MEEIKTYNTRDLVLKVNETYNPLELNLDSWDRFLDILCVDRNYQKVAIKTCIVFLASGNYKSTMDLVTENCKMNLELKNRYKSVNEYIKNLQLPDKLSGTIDLATGTGKSYVMYGVAQIMLGLGIIDRAILICPSVTIESGLTEKFQELATNSKLKQAIPQSSVVRNPRITNGNVTIKSGDICIENVHALYESTGSSIRDSLCDGEKVLVLNDEAHHIYNKVEGKSEESKSIKKWKEFLLKKEYKFKYILGFTGTAYMNDEYLNDVIYRYSLKQAVEHGIVKMVDYISKDENITETEKLQKIYDNHQESKLKYLEIKPLTIFVTKDIKSAKQLRTKIVEFLSEREKFTINQISEKVLIVTSALEHKLNLETLRSVDSKTNTIEWIISVSMLTEGWDVKNVFQIVPWEDKAFNSKLLIAQVLGRGLRLPNEYKSPQPKVKVFNHDAWSKNIRGLVEEILEIETKIYSRAISRNNPRFKYNFEIYNVSYDKVATSKEKKQETTIFDYSKGYIDLVSQVDEVLKESEYTDLYGEVYNKTTSIEYKMYSINEVVDKIHDEFYIKEWEGKILKLPKGEYGANNLPPKSDLEEIIKNSLEKVGVENRKISEKNRNRILQAFGTLNRRRGSTIIYEKKVNEPVKKSTADIRSESLSLSNLRRDFSVFYTNNYLKEIPDDIIDLITGIINDQNLPKKSTRKINQYLFKTALDIIFSKSEPERKFVEELCKIDNANAITSWIKSRDQNFYSIEYSWRKGEHQKQQTFNPDFFINITKKNKVYIIVVEIKADNDISDENKAKFMYAREHFDTLNKELLVKSINQEYFFHFLSPENFDTFFNYLKNEKLIQDKFISDLDNLLR